MAQNFLRRVVGYNRAFTESDSASTARDAWLSISCPSGPGEIEGITGAIPHGGALTYVSLSGDALKITIDGVELENEVLLLYGIEGVFGKETSGVVASTTCGDVYETFQITRKITYETSAVVELQNTVSPDPSTITLKVFGHIGR